MLERWRAMEVKMEVQRGQNNHSVKNSCGWKMGLIIYLNVDDYSCVNNYIVNKLLCIHFLYRVLFNSLDICSFEYE